MKKRLLAFVMAILMTLASSAMSILGAEEVFAKEYFPPGRLDLWSENNLLFYNPSSSSDNRCVTRAPSGNNVTLIGDSLSVGAQDVFSQRISGIDFTEKTYYDNTYKLIQVSKHFAADTSGNYGGITIAEQLKEQGDLRSVLVFALGTNDPGAVTDAVIDRLVDTVGENQRIVLVTNASDGQGNLDYSVNNAAIRGAPARHSNITVADWERAIAGSVDEYISDPTYHVHLSQEGNEKYVSVILSALGMAEQTVVSGTTGDNTNYAGVQVFTDSELSTIEANRPFYEEAAQRYGFPWQVLAVLHSLEYSNRRANPSNGQGAYQLYSYTAGGTNSNAFLPAGPLSDAEFARQTDIAASVVASYGLDLNNDDNVKLLFFRYNGTAQVYIRKAIAMGFSEEQARNGEGSAYVMNRYDARRDPTSDSMDPAWPGRYVGDGRYDSSSTTTGFGAFVKYAALGGQLSAGSYCYSSGSEDGLGGLGGGTIAETAINLSWPGVRSHAKNDPKPEYEAAMKEVGTWQSGCNSSGCAPKGASCDQFVSTVMRFSGSDPNFPIWSGSGQLSHMESSGLYQEIDHHNDINNVQPGDIFVTAHNGYHILIYIGVINGSPSQASASFNSRTGEHFAGVDFSDRYGHGGTTRYYRVFRRIQ